MSLEGTLETIALPDVLALLSVTAKTGELRIEAGAGVGSVWFDAGGLAGYDVGNHRTPVDALFALLRLPEGSFKFHTGTRVINAIAPQDVAPVLEEAESRLAQWPGIAAAVPSLYSELNLEGSVEGTVTLSPDQWQLVAAIGSGRQVAEVLDIRNFGEFEGCRAVRELVDLHLVKVSEGGAPQPPEASLSPASARTPDLSEAGEVPATRSEWYEDEGEVAQAPHEPQSAEVAETADEADGAEQAEAPEVTQVNQVNQIPEGANLSEVWNDETGQAETIVTDTPSEPVVPGPEPVNRGLLLKFLGSARN